MSRMSVKDMEGEMTTKHMIICDRCELEEEAKNIMIYGYYSPIKGWSSINNKDYCVECTKLYKAHVRKFK